MAAAKTTRNILTGVLNTGATLSIGFLAFAGVFVMTSSWLWCSAVFVLAAAYESQINGEGIGMGLRRALDPNDTRLQVLTAAAENDPNFPLRQDYVAHKAYIARLKARISALKKNHHGWLAQLKLFFFGDPEIN